MEIDLEKIERMALEIKAALFKRSNSFSLGIFRSFFRGYGLQFKEHAPYQWGDDWRLFDWKVWAKTGHEVIRVFEEERNREIILVIDLSSTLLLGYKGISKLRVLLEVSALMMMLAHQTHDRLRPCLVTSSGVRDLGFLSGTHGFSLLLKEILKVDLERERSCVHDLAFLKHYHSTKSFYLFLSDYYGFLSQEALSFLLQRPYTGFLRAISPIDELRGVSYLLKDKNYFFRQRVVKTNVLAHKRIISLRTEGPYLDHFISELWHGVPQ